MPTQKKNKYESIFILHVYGIRSSEKKGFRIDKDAMERVGRAEPGFGIFESETGIFDSLALAEKAIRRQVKNKKECKDIYGFLIDEVPKNGSFYRSDRLSARRYLKDGKLWQKCEVSGIRYFDGKSQDLGDTGFYGRDLKAIPFKEGDIVEIASRDFVQLGIIWSLPPSIEYMEPIWERHKVRCKGDIRYSRIHPDDTDDSYSIVYYNVAEDGEIGYGHFHPAVVDVLPPSFPVPKKFSAELRRRLKMLNEECEAYAKEHKDDIPF